MSGLTRVKSSTVFMKGSTAVAVIYKDGHENAKFSFLGVGASLVDARNLVEIGNACKALDNPTAIDSGAAADALAGNDSRFK